MTEESGLFNVLKLRHLPELMRLQIAFCSDAGAVNYCVSR